MNVNRFSAIVLSTSVALCPNLISAQTDTTSGQPTSAQSSQQQQQPASSTRSRNGMQDSTSGPSGNAENMKDKIFLRKASAGGMAEVQLGQLASQKSTNDGVKNFGQKMVTDHTELNNELKPFAESMSVPTPKKLNVKDQAEYDKLNGMSGTDFDKEYIAYMVKDHHEDLREFHKEAETTSDTSLKAAVDKGATVIREHLQMVNKLAHENGVTLPGRAGASAGQ